MALLEDQEIQDRLAELDGWSLEGRRIVRTFEFDDFVGSINFVDSLVQPAESMNHHPDLGISWNKVTVAITNHAEGGLTEKDFELASRIQALV
ncbi:MAG TPA: 4a-hydroxytetrahydrobiopterin dehydratase [Solirubrobacterales bacterium]|nr:4a-hydroxytetrahydrobiopterin dehydratase [Solirubrobacterales bacterium]HMU26188.1 4a-hydroxytetrahydrobiopterin dehydratase [Solirubrobacterales bacterium]HMX70299.1 4a-hydroxytetrahydrobiopterin dehydratase [Solirubrobacterales bacterium]HMY25800.1 4a-hydroxytetrahydrobiopterin dehydratase [Solirubrobacterales bacterium]HNA23666.1 4a-hydroxytetrahydrobiopterin dehydratase [Solirubrobacterales bacterium]